uniref:Selection and upkeep of intraepithelial T cells 10 n=1 Tax=Mus musculus TaxID=10090 RepID=Q8CA07_MOUSE|nr:unnamed protein product [Mus musculus]
MFLRTQMEQSQADIFALIKPHFAARNYSKSVLKPGEDILLLGIWEKHRDESEVHDSCFMNPTCNIQGMYVHESTSACRGEAGITGGCEMSDVGARSLTCKNLTCKRGCALSH